MIKKCHKCGIFKKYIASTKLRKYSGKDHIQYDFAWLCLSCLLPALIKCNEELQDPNGGQFLEEQNVRKR